MGELLFLSPKAIEAFGVLKKELLALHPDARVQLFSILAEGYCEYCGYDDPHNSCQCQNDE